MLKKSLLLISTSLSLNVANATSSAYLGANVGFANIQDWWSGSIALSVNGGYNFNNYFATEAGLTWINPINNSLSSPTPSQYSSSQSFADIAAKGSVPLSDIFNLYIKAGLGLGYSSASSLSSGYNWNGATATFNPGIYMALGGELNLGAGIHATFEDYGLYILSANNWGNINVFGVGLKYNF